MNSLKQSNIVNTTPVYNDSNITVYGNNNQQPIIDFTLFFTYGSVPIAVLIQVISVIGIIANAFLLVITSKVKTNQKNYFKLMKSLASADFLFSFLQTIRPITFAYNLMGNNWVIQMRRSIELALVSSVTCATALNLILIAADSYIAILYPLQYTTYMTSRKIYTFIIFVWVLSLVFGWICFLSAAVQKVFYFRDRNYINLVHLCRDNSWRYDIDYISILAVQFICVLVLIVIYSRVCTEIYKQQNFEKRQVGNKSAKFKKNNKGIITSIFIIGTYLALALPYYIYWTIVIATGYEYDIDISVVLLLLFCINSVCDPMIYAFRLTEVRKTIKQFCKL